MSPVCGIFSFVFFFKQLKIKTYMIHIECNLLFVSFFSLSFFWRFFFTFSVKRLHLKIASHIKKNIWTNQKFFSKLKVGDWPFRVCLATKQAKYPVLGPIFFFLVFKVISYELIFNPYIEGDHIMVFIEEKAYLENLQIKVYKYNKCNTF